MHQDVAVVDFSFAIPATASLLAVPFRSELPSPTGWAAIAVIVLGVVPASRPASQRSSASRSCLIRRVSV